MNLWNIRVISKNSSLLYSYILRLLRTHLLIEAIKKVSKWNQIIKTTRKQIITWPSWFTLVVLWKIGSAAMYRNENRSWHSNTPPKKHKLKVNEPSWKKSANYELYTHTCMQLKVISATEGKYNVNRWNRTYICLCY